MVLHIQSGVRVDITADWDYPSIAVDNSGKIVIGAVDQYKASSGYYGYYTAVSTDGINLGNPTLVLARDPNAKELDGTRVVASGNTFHAFVPDIAKATHLPTGVDRFQSGTGLPPWSGPVRLATFIAPRNNNDPGTVPTIFYAPSQLEDAVL